MSSLLSTQSLPNNNVSTFKGFKPPSPQLSPQVSSMTLSQQPTACDLSQKQTQQQQNQQQNGGLTQEQQMLQLQQLQMMQQRQQQWNTMQLLMNICPGFDEKANYTQEFFKVYITNEYLHKQIEELLSDRRNLQERIRVLEAKIGEQKDEDTLSQTQISKKKNRRTAQQIDKQFICPYDNCSKGYGSDVSLNLHIKIKHNGGSKTEREKLAKAVMLAKINKDDIPNLNIEFPPGYLDNFEDFMKQDLQNSELKVKNHKDSNHLIHSTSKDSEQSSTLDESQQIQQQQTYLQQQIQQNAGIEKKLVL